MTESKGGQQAPALTNEHVSSENSSAIPRACVPAALRPCTRVCESVHVRACVTLTAHAWGKGEADATCPRPLTCPEKRECSFSFGVAEDSVLQSQRRVP